MRRQKLDSLLNDLGEMLAAQEGGTVDYSRFTPYADRPVDFIRDILGDEPWSMQRRIARAVALEPQVTVRSCHAAGKDWLSARLALWWTYSRRGLVVLTGPTASQVREILMRGEVRDAFEGSGLPGHLGVKALRPAGQGQGRAGILARTSNAVSSLTGFHDARVMVCVTEAQSPDCDPAWEASFALATGAEDRILTVGNPTERSGRFYRAHRPGSAWTAYRIAAEDVPNVAEDREVIPGLLSTEGVDRFVKEYGPDSGTVATRVRAAFPDQPEDGLYRRSELEAAMRRYEDGVLEPGAVVCGLDVARQGPNSSVLCIRRGPVVDELLAWDCDSTATLIDHVRAALAERGLQGAPLLIDATGLGGHVADRLRELGYGAVDFRAGGSAEDSESYRNCRAEAYWRVKLALEEGRIALPRDVALVEELLAQRYTPTADGRVQIEAKHLISSRLGRSPDRADSLVMAWYPRIPSTTEPERHQVPSYENDISGNFLDKTTRSKGARLPFQSH